MVNVNLFCFIVVIVTDKANILLRYLHQQWEVKVSFLSLTILKLVLKVDATEK